jgi:hypothetical protein
LVTALSRLSSPWSARQQRQLAYLSEFTSDIRHTPGHANVVADALSRPSPSPARRREQKAQHNPPPSLYQPKGANLSAAALHANNGSKPLPPAAATAFTPQPTATAEPAAPLTEPLDFVAMAAAQRECPDFKTMQASPSIQLVYSRTGDHFLYGDVSTGVFRPFIPRQFRSAVILSQHNLHHPGIRATTRLVTAAYCWPHMGRTIADAARACLGCQKGKVQKHIRLQPEHIAVPQRRFTNIHVDIVGPLPVSAAATHIFTIIDRTTRWPEAVPLSGTTAANCAAALLTGWIQRFGLPCIITSDRGPQFTSSLWSALCSLLSIKHSPTTAYHPQSNGIVERFHRRLKDALRARAAGPRWVSQLPWVMLGIRTAWRDGDFSPAEAVFGAQPILPGQFLDAPDPPPPNFIADFQGLLDSC